MRRAADAARESGVLEGGSAELDGLKWARTIAENKSPTPE
jgi:hypothetical protein